MSFTDFADFTVPQFSGFNMEPANEEVETYFEYNHESNYFSVSETNSSTGDDSDSKWQPSGEVFYDETEEIIEEQEVKYTLRKSMSTGDLTALATYNMKTEPMSPMPEEDHKLNCTLLKHKSLSRLNLKERKMGMYESVAEKMNKFWTTTPERFRSRPKLNSGSQTIVVGTIPKTPNLSTKSRSRPVTVLSRQQLEEMEMEEAKRHQIKAHPMNPKILQDPKFKPVHKKPTTKLKPFHLTETKTKKNDGPMKALVPQFHAKPVPKSVYDKPKDLRPVPPKMVVQKVIKRTASKESLTQEGKPRLSRTEPKPFSFDSRDQQIIRKREALLNKVLEEEKKAREFHARPIPKSLVSSKGHNGSTSSIRSNKSEDANDHNTSKPKMFKATSPKVLHQKPFVPKKMERALVEVAEFQLNTVVRAREREEFEMKKREKEETANRWRLENEMRQKQQELEEIARLRKEMEHKANGIRRFKELPVIPKGKLTAPISPKFSSGKSNKENVNL